MAVVELTHWTDLAACRDNDDGAFFEPDAETADERRAREAEAKAICATCRVTVDCRVYVDSMPVNKYGIYAGENGAERQRRRRNERRRAACRIGAKP